MNGEGWRPRGIFFFLSFLLLSLDRSLSHWIQPICEQRSEGTISVIFHPEPCEIGDPVCCCRGELKEIFYVGFLASLNSLRRRSTDYKRRKMSSGSGRVVFGFQTQCVPDLREHLERTFQLGYFPFFLSLFPLSVPPWVIRILGG